MSERPETRLWACPEHWTNRYDKRVECNVAVWGRLGQPLRKCGLLMVPMIERGAEARIAAEMVRVESLHFSAGSLTVDRLLRLAAAIEEIGK